MVSLSSIYQVFMFILGMILMYGVIALVFNSLEKLNTVKHGYTIKFFLGSIFIVAMIYASALLRYA